MLKTALNHPTALFLGAMLLGAFTGLITPGITALSEVATDPLIIALVTLIFFTLRLQRHPGASRIMGAGKVLITALVVNFLVVPIIAVAVGSLLLPHGVVQLGVLLYCLYPCTDWFLGFTRAAGGDTSTGGMLVPIQMGLQILLFPFWLQVFTGLAGLSAPGSASALGVYLHPEVASTLFFYVLLPAGIGLGLQALTRSFTVMRRVRGWADDSVSVVLAAIIFLLFAGHIGELVAEPSSTLLVLAAVFCFFVAIYLVGELASRVLHLPYRHKALLVMTTSARNAPLMIALTTAFIPQYPQVTAVLVVGMLLEFPHLCAVTALLRRQAPHKALSRPAHFSNVAATSGT